MTISANTPPSPATANTSDAQRASAVAIIPARGGSKGIPLKNLQKIGGRSLLARAIETAQRSTGIDTVVVSTDHQGIAEEARAHGAEVVMRPDDISGDTASSESALLYTLAQLSRTHRPFDITVFIQCTSPFISPQDLDEATEAVAAGRHDVVFSAAVDHSFLWKLSSDNTAEAVGHSAEFRPRRQDREPHYSETGAFYVMRTAGFQESGHRFFGSIGIQEVPEDDAREIDSLSDLTLLRALADQRQQDTSQLSELDIDAVVTDFDGVHTDDRVFTAEDGTETVPVHRGDGMGVSRLVKAGVPFLILSKERNPVVTRRAEKLRVEVAQGIDNKASVIADWMASHGLDPARVAYVGNDVNDLEAFSEVGWPIAVADAHPAVLAAARHVLAAEGGRGAVREVCDLVHVPTRHSASAQEPDSPTTL